MTSTVQMDYEPLCGLQSETTYSTVYVDVTIYGLVLGSRPSDPSLL